VNTGQLLMVGVRLWSLDSTKEVIMATKENPFFPPPMPVVQPGGMPVKAPEMVRSSLSSQVQANHCF
jgi:hypothetical protein